jgi:hypothetical protein
MRLLRLWFLLPLLYRDESQMRQPGAVPVLNRAFDAPGVRLGVGVMAAIFGLAGVASMEVTRNQWHLTYFLGLAVLSLVGGASTVAAP